MSILQADVFVSPAIPTVTGSLDPIKQMWSPISSTLIQGASSAILADTPVTAEQASILADWIEATAPNKTLEYIFITHAHGDHFLGAPVLLKRFPGAKLVATASVVAGCEQQLSPQGIQKWQNYFPGQLPANQIVPTALPENGEFLLEGHICKAIDVAHSDTHASSFLHAPSLKLVVAGDIVYGDCYQSLREANTAEKRKQWIEALDQIAALEPNVVVPGHKRATQIDSASLVEETKRYILEWEEELEKAGSAEDLEAAIIRRYPQRWNRYILEVACKATV